MSGDSVNPPWAADRGKDEADGAIAPNDDWDEDGGGEKKREGGGEAV